MGLTANRSLRGVDATHAEDGGIEDTTTGAVMSMSGSGTTGAIAIAGSLTVGGVPVPAAGTVDILEVWTFGG